MPQSPPLAPTLSVDVPLASRGWPAFNYPRDAMPYVGRLLKEIEPAVLAAVERDEQVVPHYVWATNDWASARISIFRSDLIGASVRTLWTTKRPDVVTVLVEPHSRKLNSMQWLMIPVFLVVLALFLAIAAWLLRQQQGLAAAAVALVGLVLSVIASAKSLTTIINSGVSIDLRASRSRATTLAERLADVLPRLIAAASDQTEADDAGATRERKAKRARAKRPKKESQNDS